MQPVARQQPRKHLPKNAPRNNGRTCVFYVMTSRNNGGSRVFYAVTSPTIETVFSMGSVQSAYKRSEFRSGVFYAVHSKQKSYKIMKIKMFATLDKANPDKGNIRGLNLAAVKHTTVQVSRLPMQQEKLIIGYDLLY
jgi:hypothetical protein